MPGFSLSLLLLPGASDKNAPDANKLLALLDEPASVPGWKWTVGKPPAAKVIEPTAAAAAADTNTVQISAADPKGFIEAIQRACQALIKEEPEITRMDNIAGDGDCGLTLKAGAEGNFRIQSARVDIDGVRRRPEGGRSWQYHWRRRYWGHSGYCEANGGTDGWY